MVGEASVQNMGWAIHLEFLRLDFCKPLCLLQESLSYLKSKAQSTAAKLFVNSAILAAYSPHFMDIIESTSTGSRNVVRVVVAAEHVAAAQAVIRWLLTYKI